MSDVIGVFGSWRAGPGSELYRSAYGFGRSAAEAGYTLLTGGYSGVMEAAARGAFEAGGETIGVLCPEIDTQLLPNPYLTRRVHAPGLLQRAAECIDRSSHVLFFPGRLGTVAELALAMERAAKNPPGSPVLLWGDFWTPLLEAITETVDALPFPSSPDALPPFAVIRSATDALTLCSAAPCRRVSGDT